MDKYPNIQQRFSVPFEYPLVTTKGIFDINNQEFVALIGDIEQPSKFICFIDENVAKSHSQLLKQIVTYSEEYTHLVRLVSAPQLIEGGEAAKNTDKHVQQVVSAIEEHAICRHSYVVVIGGGAVIDTVGYAAAIAHRGVRLIRIPTTVLAQNDSAVGVKNGINAFGKKNFIGTFAPPFAVINDQEFLTTLEQRDWIAGISEAIKVALIKDASFYEFIRKAAYKLSDRDEGAMQELIYRCAKLHMQHIASGDPFESGSSRPLDFGHWSAHKLEHMSNFTMRHGEAVAKGMALDVCYSFLLGLIDAEVCNNILEVLQAVGFDISIDLNAKDQRILLGGLEEFREHLGGELTITLIDAIGSKKDVHEIDYALMKDALVLLNNKVKSNVVK